MALGAYGLLVQERRAFDILCGFGFAMSVLCRPTAALGFASVGTYLLPDLIRAFKGRYPEVLPRLSEGTHDALEARVASGELDLCIVSLPVKRLDLVIRTAEILTALPARFLLVGDGPRRAQVEHMLRLSNAGRIVHLLGWRDDVPQILAAQLMQHPKVVEESPCPLSRGQYAE